MTANPKKLILEFPNMDTESFVGTNSARAEGAWSDLALHTIGWKSFQDLCSEVCQEYLKRPVEIFHEAKDGGQDAVFLFKKNDGDSEIGTVQCKYVSNPNRNLRLSDITGELEKVNKLVSSNQADSYIFITNLSTNAKTAAVIRAELFRLGVRKPHVLGRQFLVRVIRGSSRLRALVPQVYGLGDLSTILDERALAQAEEMLGHWRERLKAYVPTAAHREAVRSIDSHGIVLLLGNPSVGKSAIGAILSTIASDGNPYKVLFINSPRQFEDHWNPNEKNRFYWIDDAFGANKLRDDFVDDWALIFPKLKIALKHGNRFLFTSRMYIYRAAKNNLGSRNLREFISEEAVVNVGQLTLGERSQILYNHIKFGNQSDSWKFRVKPYLQYIAEVQDFLPGISERLGDRAFTKKLRLDKGSLVCFMEEPKEHLVSTIVALDEPIRALLVLLYVHKGKLRLANLDEAAVQAVVELTGVPKSEILSCLSAADGSFVRHRSDSKLWEFAHPTIFDALTEIISNEGHMVEALLRGATLPFVLNEFVCEGKTDKHRTEIPSKFEDLLLERLWEIEDEKSINLLYLRFLCDRSSDSIFTSVFKEDKSLLHRNVSYSTDLAYDPIVGICARAYRLGILEEETRREFSDKIRERIINEFDFTIMDHSELLDLIESKTLLEIGGIMKSVLEEHVLTHIQEIGSDSSLDLELDADNHFSDIEYKLNTLESALTNSDLQQEIDAAYTEIETAVAEITIRKDEFDEEARAQEERDREEEKIHDIWRESRRDYTTRIVSDAGTNVKISDDRNRSIFSDVVN